MKLGDDLSLDLLSENDNTLFEDLVIDSDKSQIEKETTATKPAEQTSGEGATLESVAGEGGTTKTSEKNTNVNDSDSSPKDGSDDLSEIYSSLATHLHKSGVLSNLDKETPVKSFNDLQNLIKNEITTGLEGTAKAYKEAMERGVPEDQFVRYERTMQQLNSITPEVLKEDNNVELRAKIIAQDFLNRGYNQEEATKYAKRSVDLGEDVEDANSALNKIKDFEKENFEKVQKSIKEEEDKVNGDIKQFIDKTSEFIEGIKVDENQKANLFKQITTPVGRDKDGTVLSKYGKALKEDPTKMRVTTEYLFMITDGFTDFSKLNTTIETAKTKELDTILKNNMSSFSQDGTVNFKNNDENANFLMDDLQLDV